MDTNIKIVEKIDPLTDSEEIKSKRRKTPDSSRSWALKTSIRSLKLVETNSELNNRDRNCVPNDGLLLVTARKLRLLDYSSIVLSTFVKTTN